jgi:dihydroorotate dehydrogenase
MAKTESGKVISKIVISTIGEFGMGMIPYVFYKSYWEFMLAAKKNTTQLTKSFTALPHTGKFIKWNPLTWKYIKRIPGDGIANAYEHTNPGAVICAKKIKRSHKWGFKSIVPNYYPDFSKPYAEMLQETLTVIEMLYETLGSDFFALELKLYCPNIRQDLEENIRLSTMLVSEIRKHYADLLLIIKVNYQHPFELSQEMERLGVYAIHAINAINHKLIFKDCPNPLGLEDCAISGAPIKPYSLAYNRGLRKKIQTPILMMGGGIMSTTDAREFLDIGADSLVICSMVAKHPREARLLIEIHN